MYSKEFLVLFAVVVLLASAAVARAGNFTNERDSGLNTHQTELDEQFARRANSYPAFVPNPPAGNSTPYGYVPRHRPTAKRRHGTNS